MSMVLAVTLAVLAALALAFPKCDVENRTYQDLNDVRLVRGLPALTSDGALASVAEQRSADMVIRDYFSHTPPPPDSCDAFCLMTRAGIPHPYGGEILAQFTGYSVTDSEPQAIAAWVASPGHLAVITGHCYQRFGVGLAESTEGRIVYTVVFTGTSC